MDFYLGLAPDHRRPHAARALGLLRAADRPDEPRAGRLLCDRRLCGRHADRARGWPIVPALAVAGARRGRRGLRGRLPGAARQGADAGGRDAGVRRGGAAVLLQFQLPARARRLQARAAWRRGVSPDPLFPRARLVDARGDAVHLGCWSCWSWRRCGGWTARAPAPCCARSARTSLPRRSSGINVTAVKVTAMTVGGVIAGVGGGLFAHYTTHIEHVQFGVVLATFAVAYPILGGLSNVFGTLLAVIFIQGFLIEGLRFMGDWRNLLFGGLIVLAMNVRPRGLIDAGDGRRARSASFATGSAPVLELKGLTKHFGGVRAVDGVDLTVRAGRNPRPDRAERLGQEHHRQSDLRPVPADRRSRRCCAATDISDAAAARARRRSASRARSRTSACSASSPSGRICGSRRTPSAQRRGKLPAPLARRLAPRAAPRSTARSNSSISRTSATNSPPILRSASSGGWNSPARSPPSPRWCCSTSRPPA